jgi:exodeoxyribonuclease V alpha subunit
VVLNLDKRRVPYALCSFTGRAVARIREVTNKQTPATLHRLIVDKKYQLGENLIDYECVIIDEASMVTTELLYEFLQYYRQVKRLILVGDVNQLEPIDWGCLFHQLLKSGTVPIYQLTTNFRVYEVKEELDGITLNSNALINHDPHYPFEFTETLNFSIIKGGINTVLDIIKGCFSSGIKVNQVVIITPYTRLFKVLDPGFQNIYNTSGHGVTDSRGNQWLVGDLVMLQENDDRAKIYNGETGTIKSTTATSITVDFGVSGCHVFQLEAKLVDRNRYQMTGIREKERTVRQLKLAYTLSIDKSQGSEYDFVILYIDEYNAGSFLYMNRIYTALTRAKRCVWVVTSDPEAFKIVAVRPPAFRCDNLARRLLEVLPPIIPEVPWGDEGRPDWGYDEDDY